MKKIFSSLIVAFFAVAMMAGGAWAASEFTQPVAAIVLSAELGSKLADNDYDFEDDVVFESQNTGSLVSFTTGIGMNDGDKITFELSNGLFKDDSYFLVDATDPGLTKTSLGSVVSTLDPTNGVSSVTFRIENGPIANGTEIVIVRELDAGALVPNPAEDKETILIRAASTLGDGDKIRIRITNAEDVGGTPLPGGNSDWADLIELETQFAFTITMKTSIIDVDQQRLFFGDAVGEKESTAVLEVDNDANTTLIDWIVVDGTDDFTLSLTSDDWSGVDLTDNTTTFWDDSLAANPVALVLVGDTASATVDGTKAQIPAKGLAADDNVITISVDGTTVLATRSFTGNMAIDFDDADIDDVSVDLGNTHVWDINGYQATTPYMYATSEGTYDTFAKFYNSSNQDAEVFVDVSTDDGASTGTSQLADIPAGQVGIFWASDIATAAGLPDNAAFAATFTITAPKAKVTGVCFFKRENGDRQMPLFTTQAQELNSALMQ